MTFLDAVMCYENRLQSQQSSLAHNREVSKAAFVNFITGPLTIVLKKISLFKSRRYDPQTRNIEYVLTGKRKIIYITDICLDSC